MEFTILIRPDYYAKHKKALEKDLGNAGQPDHVKRALYQQKNFSARMLNEKGHSGRWGRRSCSTYSKYLSAKLMKRRDFL